MRRPLAILAVAAVFVLMVSAWDARGGDIDIQTLSAATTSVPLATTSTTSTTSTSTSTTTTTVPLRDATMVFTGDIIPHGAVRNQAAANATGDAEFDFAPMFAPVVDVIAGADLAICHLESPLAADNVGLSGYPTFNAPRELADGIAAAGYDGCSTASNHSFDKGVDGINETVQLLLDAGVGQVGMARSVFEAATPTLYDAGGISVGHLSATYGLNGFELPADAPFLVDLLDAELIRIRASAARAAGAEFVVVSLHWGSEYRRDPSEAQRALAAELLPHADIDLIVGHHAHVVQPIDVIDGEYVVYGLGNFLSNQSSACCVAAAQDGVIVEVALTELDDGGFETSVAFTPTSVDRSSYTVVPQTAGVSFDRTVEAMQLLGAEVYPR